MIRFLLLSFLCFLCFLTNGQTAIVSGKVKAADNTALGGAILKIVNEANSVVAENDGSFLIEVPAQRSIFLEVSYVGFNNQLIQLFLNEGEKRKVNVTLEITGTAIDEVIISGDQEIRKVVSATTIDGELLEEIPAVTGGVETLIKTLPGVNSSNELSSQYSVRGGNFDENLVYINGFEVYRPQLIRSGQQEGLSIINPDMTGKIYFSSGGFESFYGDKLSSVLDIVYKRPTELEGSAYLGFLGTGAHLQNVSENGKLSYVAGARYQTNKYLLNTLDEAGEYNPYSQDGQILLGYELSKKTKIEALGYFGRTVYDFVPNVQRSNFGSINNILTFSADLDGAEVDEFQTAFGGLSLSNSPNESTILKFNVSAHSGNESEDINIVSDYLLGFLDPVSKNLRHFFAWGVGYKAQSFEDDVFEIEKLDTTSLTLPGMPMGNVFFQQIDATNSIDNNIISGFVQDTYELDQDGDIVLTGGVRVSNSSYTQETLISPRLQFSFRPEGETDVLYRGAVGLYQQHPQYRDLRRRDGTLNENIVAQKSFQAIVGADIELDWKVPVKFTAEAYHKELWDVIPYEYDVLRIRYLGENNATAFVSGLDFRLNGEFVEDAESWLSLSILKTEEEIEGQGVVRRPTDQRVNASLLFQDYLPNNKNFRVKLVGNYGSKFPVGIANGNRLDDDFNVPSYQRFDVGFAANLKGRKASRLPNSPFEKLRSVWLTAEVFNMFDNDNTQSFQWVFTPDNVVYAVPNDLTGRRLNAKLTVRF